MEVARGWSADDEQWDHGAARPAEPDADNADDDRVQHGSDAWADDRLHEQQGWHEDLQTYRQNALRHVDEQLEPRYEDAAAQGDGDFVAIDVAGDGEGAPEGMDYHAGHSGGRYEQHAAEPGNGYDLAGRLPDEGTDEQLQGGEAMAYGTAGDGAQARDTDRAPSPTASRQHEPSAGRAGVKGASRGGKPPAGGTGDGGGGEGKRSGRSSRRSESARGNDKEASDKGAAAGEKPGRISGGGEPSAKRLRDGHGGPERSKSGAVEGNERGGKGKDGDAAAHGGTGRGADNGAVAAAGKKEDVLTDRDKARNKERSSKDKEQHRSKSKEQEQERARSKDKERGGKEKDKEKGKEHGKDRSNEQPGSGRDKDTGGKEKEKDGRVRAKDSMDKEKLAGNDKERGRVRERERDLDKGADTLRDVRGGSGSGKLPPDTATATVAAGTVAASGAPADRRTRELIPAPAFDARKRPRSHSPQRPAVDRKGDAGAARAINNSSGGQAAYRSDRGAPPPPLLDRKGDGGAPRALRLPSPQRRGPSPRRRSPPRGFSPQRRPPSPFRGHPADLDYARGYEQARGHRDVAPPLRGPPPFRDGPYGPPGAPLPRGPYGAFDVRFDDRGPLPRGQFYDGAGAGPPMFGREDGVYMREGPPRPPIFAGPRGGGSGGMRGGSGSLCPQIDPYDPGQGPGLGRHGGPDAYDGGPGPRIRISDFRGPEQQRSGRGMSPGARVGLVGRPSSPLRRGYDVGGTAASGRGGGDGPLRMPGPLPPAGGRDARDSFGPGPGLAYSNEQGFGGSRGGKARSPPPAKRARGDSPPQRPLMALSSMPQQRGGAPPLARMPSGPARRDEPSPRNVPPRSRMDAFPDDRNPPSSRGRGSEVSGPSPRDAGPYRIPAGGPERERSPGPERAPYAVSRGGMQSAERPDYRAGAPDAHGSRQGAGSRAVRAQLDTAYGERPSLDAYGPGSNKAEYSEPRGPTRAAAYDRDRDDAARASAGTRDIGYSGDRAPVAGDRGRFGDRRGGGGDTGGGSGLSNGRNLVGGFVSDRATGGGGGGSSGGGGASASLERAGDRRSEYLAPAEGRAGDSGGNFAASRDHNRGGSAYLSDSRGGDGGAAAGGSGPRGRDVRVTRTDDYAAPGRGGGRPHDREQGHDRARERERSPAGGAHRRTGLDPYDSVPSGASDRYDADSYRGRPLPGPPERGSDAVAGTLHDHRGLSRVPLGGDISIMPGPPPIAPGSVIVLTQPPGPPSLPPGLVAPRSGAATATALQGVSEDEKSFFYSDPQGVTQGPCSLRDLKRWVGSLNAPEYVTEYNQFLQSPVWRRGAESIKVSLAQLLAQVK